MGSNTWTGQAETTRAEGIEEQRIPLSLAGRPIELDISNPSGEVTVRAGDGSDALVRSVKHGSPGSSRYAEAELGVDVDDNRIKIETRSARFDLGRVFRGDVTFDVTVELPRAMLASKPAQVRVHTASGNVLIEEIAGEVTLHTASGDVRVDRVSGEITAHSASGDLRLSALNGDFRARTASGDVTVAGGSLTRFAVATASGDTRIEAELTGDASSKVETVSGDVTIEFNHVPDGELRFSSVSGGAMVAAPFRSVGKRTWRLGPSERGGPSIAVRTVSGDLHVEARAEPKRDGASSAEIDRSVADTAPLPPTPPVPPIPPTPPDERQEAAVDSADALAQAATERRETASRRVAESRDDEERLTVLQALERGEIDIDEALNQLDEMDSMPEASTE